MNWDEKVVRFQHERGINAMAIGASESIAANRQARIIARWQREQLRTPEAIERMAVAIYEMEDPLANAGWAFESEGLKDTYRKWAKGQITALLGED